jgi:hypothetical protein
MRGRRRERISPKRDKTLHVEFDLEAIREIKRRKRGVCKRDSKKSKRNR